MWIFVFLAVICVDAVVSARVLRDAVAINGTCKSTDDAHYRFTFLQPLSGMYMSNVFFLDLKIDRISLSDELVDNQLSPFWIAVKMNNKFIVGNASASVTPTLPVLNSADRTTHRLQFSKTEAKDQWKSIEFAPEPHYGRQLQLAVAVEYDNVRPRNEIEIFIRLDEPLCSPHTSVAFLGMHETPIAATTPATFRSHYHKQNIVLFNLQGDPKIESFLATLPTFNQHVLLAGFYECNLPFFANIRAEKYELWLMDDSVPLTVSQLTDGFLCTRRSPRAQSVLPLIESNRTVRSLGTAELINVKRLRRWSHDPLSMFRVVARVQVSLVYLDMLIAYRCQQLAIELSLCTAESLRAMPRHLQWEIFSWVDSYVQRLFDISRRTVSLFVGTPWRELIQRSLQRDLLAIRFQTTEEESCVFQSVRWGSPPVDSHWIGNLEMWLWTASATTRQCIDRLRDPRPLVSQNDVQMPAVTATATAAAMGMNTVSEVRVTRQLASDFTIGKPYFLLENVCVTNDDSADEFNTMTLTGQQQMVSFSIQHEPFFNSMSELVQEDRGFMYSGLRFYEIKLLADDDSDAKHVESSPSDEFQAHWRMSDALAAQQLALWMPGLSLWASSVSPNHLCHDSEILVQLVVLAKQFYDCIQRASSVSASKAAPSASFAQSLRTCRYYSSHFDNLIGQSDRVVLAKTVSKSSSDWIEGMLAIFIDYYHSRTQVAWDNAIKLNPNLHMSELPKLSTRRLTLFNRDDIFDATQSSLVCFDRVAFLGRNNGHVTYFTSHVVGQDIKCHLYDVLGLSVERHPNTDLSLACPLNSLRTRDSQIASSNRSLFAHDSQHTLQFDANFATAARRRPLRITITVRSGQRRQYLNLLSIQRLLLQRKSLSSSSADEMPIDVEWLRSHVVYIGTLSLQEQAELFAETDVLVAGHGAEMMNGLFLRAGSVVIDVFVGPYYEHYLEPMLREVGVKTLVMTPHKEDIVACPPETPPACADKGILGGASLDCLQLRNCNRHLAEDELLLLLQQAYFHVLSAKFMFPGDNL